MTRTPNVRVFRPKQAAPRPDALPELQPEEDRRLLRVSLAVAALVHLGLLFLPMPWTGAAAAPEPPPEVTGCRVITLRAPPPPPTDTTPPPAAPATPIPVPEWRVEEAPADDAPPPLPTPELPADVPVIYLDPPPPPAPPAPAGPTEKGPIYVVGAVEPPVAIHDPSPVYPETARQIRKGGLVIVQVVVEKDGTVTDVEVLKAEPFGLTEAAVDAVERWRFEPARLGGEPVAVYFQLTVRFTLQ
jgi:periplasmic protein TonB